MLIALRETSLFAESWNVAFRKKPAGTVLSDTETPFILIENAFRYWAADPFVLEQNGEVYIFAELYDYVLCRGVLGYCRIVGDKPTKWIPVIKEPYHLSYPCTVSTEEGISLMPESGEGNVLSRYIPVGFPNSWKKAEVLRDEVRFADTTPIPVAGARYALTHQVDDPENPKLVMIDLKGQEEDWVVENAVPLRSRPAGHFFFRNGKLIRPAQYSENPDDGYGKALVFYECRWENGTYSESEITMLKPEQLTYNRYVFLDGMHTYNGSEHYEVIDIKTRRFNPLNFAMRIVGKLRRH